MIVVHIFDNTAICLLGYKALIPLSFISGESGACLFLSPRFVRVAVALPCTEPMVKCALPAAPTHQTFSLHLMGLLGTCLAACFRNINAQVNSRNRIVSVLEISDFLFAHRESLSSLNQCSDSVLSSDLADQEMLFWFVTNTVLQNFSGI